MLHSEVAVEEFQYLFGEPSHKVEVAAVIRAPASPHPQAVRDSMALETATAMSSTCPIFFSTWGSIVIVSMSVTTIPSTTGFFMMPAAVLFWAARAAAACSPGIKYM